MNRRIICRTFETKILLYPPLQVLWHLLTPLVLPPLVFGDFGLDNYLLFFFLPGLKILHPAYADRTVLSTDV